MKMDNGFIDYLAISPKGRRDYLNFIIDLANITTINAGSNGITEETVTKAKLCKADALRQLEHMKKEHKGPETER
jgi:hypothetical protein